MYVFEKDKIKEDIVFIENEKKKILDKCSTIFKDYKDDDEIECLVDMINGNLRIMYKQLELSKKTNTLIRNKVWFHRTSKNNLNSILSENFKLPNIPGRFGCGVYFSSNEEYYYSTEPCIKVYIEADILSLWHSEICNIFEDENIQPDEGGTYFLEEYAIKNGYKAVEVKYLTEVSELIVYDVDVIKFV